jgi:uncharacterized protein (TIGR02271 family)
VAGRGNPQPEPWGADPERLGTREEHFQAGTSWTHGDDVTVRKWVETTSFHEDVPRNVDTIDAEHVPPEPADDGEIHELSDGTLSIPIFEEQIVISRRTVVRERLLLRRQIIAETVEVNEEVRREQFDLSAEDGTPVDVQRQGRTSPFPGSSADPRRRSG